MKNKKPFVLTLLITICSLFFVLCSLFISCQNPFEPPHQVKPESGKGYFSLTIGTGARTIMPEAALGDFAAFTLEFYASGNNTSAFLSVERTSENLSDPILLNAGTWDLYVSAWLDAEKTKLVAKGELKGIVIGVGGTTARSVILGPIADGEGTFSWIIDYPTDVTSASMTITPLDESGTPAQVFSFTDWSYTHVNKNSFLTLNAGYYRVVFRLQNSEGLRAERRETLHVYQNMESVFEFIFESVHFVNDIVVSINADSGPGSLRDAISSAPDGARIIIAPNVGTIALSSTLNLNKSLTIEGNGVIITRDAAAGDLSRMMYILGSNEVIISRIWFKDGRASSSGGTVYTSQGNLTLESCIFSGNRSTNATVYSGSNGTMIVSGCTFYGNSATSYGGAIYNYGTLILTGNLFYGNTASSYPVVYRGSGTVTSGGYNVVDVPFGTGSAQSGWTAGNGDITISSLPISPVSFRLLSGSEAANVLSTLPADYPAEDFYGIPITNGAAAGAVQSTASGSGYVLDLSVSNSNRGSVSATPAPSADGLVSGTVTITATVVEGYELMYWLEDGEKVDNTNPLVVTLTGYKKVQAVFGTVFIVNNFTDESGSASVVGTLRYALANAEDGDIIRLSDVTPGSSVIELTGNLPSITRDITIEGNGVTLTPAASWNNNRMMFINGGTVTISRIHFKDGRLSSDSGVAAYNNSGNLSMESCIFSGNQSYYGGAICNNGGTLNMKGCTFVSNSAPTYYGGAIYNANSGTLTLTGNLFYGNTASQCPVVYRSSGTVTSNGYNVVDVAFGTGIAQNGWTAHTSDSIISSPPVSLVSFKILSGSGADSVITTLPAGYPAVDFYGNTITNNAAAGAVQAMASGSGYVLDITVNDSTRGSVSAVPPPDAEGFVSGTVTITATLAEGYELFYWLVNGTNVGSTNPLVLTPTAHSRIQAVFGRVITVDNFSDASGSASVVGTLRHAITNAQDGDIIRLDKETAGATVIELSSALPDITRSITIEGNGVTLTPTATATIRLMYIRNAAVEVTISRVWFKDGGGASYNGAGAALYREGGTLTLESCIFSGNQTSSSGGAIYNIDGTLNVKGCTFVSNSADTYGGGAIFNTGTLTLTGNLFYGNPSRYYPVVYRGSGTVTSDGYNAVDVPLGTGSTESGWITGTGDITISGMPISMVSFRLLSGSEAANILTTLPADYPAVDFYGSSIINGAAAGAVQSTASGSGYVLDLSVSNSTRGSVNATPAPDADGLISGTVTITATVAEGYELMCWLVDGERAGDANPLVLTLTDHTKVQAVFGTIFIVDNFTDASGSATTAGTLRHAITNAQDGDIIRLDKETAGTTVIELSSALPDITRSITIEGNGVTLTPTAANIRLMNINSNTADVTISRVWFKDGLWLYTSNYGGAVVTGYGILSLESCIFSGNQSYLGGGAIYNRGTLNVKGCTFVSNSTTYIANNYGGGAIYNTSSGTLTLTGNLFYGNTSPYNPVVYRGGGTVTSNGYNVVDVPLGTGNTQSGWIAGTGDITISSLPISPVNFRLLFGSGAANVLTTLPADYPVKDFYGNDIADGAAAGAVQSMVSGSGYYLGLSVNTSARGSVSASPQPDADGLVPANVTITATVEEGYQLGYWLVNGIKSGNDNPLTLTLAVHTSVQAVFSGEFVVDNFSDASGSATTAGTLRYAITNAQDGDTIRLDKETAGETVIELSSALPDITKSITIEGNGVILTPAATATIRLMYISGTAVEVTISRVWFKDGLFTNSGGAVYNNYGILSMESCIFSGNQSNYYGGAICNSGGTLNVKGCTFVSNIATSYGAIYNSNSISTLTLTGNLFYGNTSNSYPVVSPSGTRTSNGYNVVDVAFGTGSAQSGWTAGTGDATIEALLGANTTSPFVDIDTLNLAPVSGLGSVIPDPPPDGFPTTDFYGNTRTWPGAPGAVK
jgi:hypothetical protein